jgi:hypothetical protein
LGVGAGSRSRSATRPQAIDSNKDMHEQAVRQYLIKKTLIRTKSKTIQKAKLSERTMR